MTGTQLALCDPTWTDTVDAQRAVDRALARIERQTLAEPANPHYKPKRSRPRRRVRTIRLATEEYL